MVGLPNRLFFLSLVASIPPILYLNWQPLLNGYAGRIDMKDFKHLTEHINHGPINNEKCWTFPGMNTLTYELHELTVSRGQGM
jgi:hypothetical protein